MTARLDDHSVSVSDANNQASDEKAAQALDLLQREARIHQQQNDQTGLISRAVAGVTEFWHQSGSTGAQVDALSGEIKADLAAGKTADANTLATGAKAAIAADQAALASKGEISQVGSGIVQAAGLFMGGRKGLVVAGAAAALEAFKPGSQDSFGTQMADVGLGVSRAMALKGGMALAAKLNLGLATTAIGLGVESRFSELALNRKTYLDDKTGNFNAGLGAERVWDGTTNKAALATDIASLLIARGALGKLNAETNGALTTNKFLSTVAVGGVFGLSQGSVNEVFRQSRAGAFDPAKFAERTVTSGLTSMLGAAIGGAAGAQRAAAAERLAPAVDVTSEVASDQGARLKVVFNGGNLKQNFADSTMREYQLVGDSRNIAQIMSRSNLASVLARVREIGAGGKLGPEQNLLVQHVGDGIPVDPKLAAKADAIATSNPEFLPLAARFKHIMPSVQEALWLSQKPGGLLSFTSFLPGSFKPGEPLSVALGNRPVSEILQDPTTLEKIYAQPNPHDLGLYSQVLKGFKIPAKQVLVGGADSLVLELADDSILKITHQQWNPEWGFRTYRDAQGMPHEFDARIIGKEHTFDRPDGMATYYIQERAQPISRQASEMIFADRLAKDGKYSFWDRDPTQLGLVLRDGKPVVRLLDYDAVRPPHLVPRDLKVPHEDRFDFDDRIVRY